MEIEKIREEVLSRLRADMLSADLRVSLLVAALSSYRHDTVLRPFPPMFAAAQTESGISNGHQSDKDYKRLVNSLKDTHMILVWNNIQTFSFTHFVCSKSKIESNLKDKSNVEKNIS